MTQPTVLMIEDNPADVFLISEAIRHNGVSASLVVVEDGESAIHYIEQGDGAPALIVLDLNLPKRSGFQILEVIRATPDYHDVPVIVFTSSMSEQDMFRMRSMGVKACLLMSLDLDEFNRIGFVVKQALLGSKGLT